MRTIISIIILLSVVSCAPEKNEAIVAQIGDFSVSEESFEYAFADFYRRTGRSISVNSLSKKQILESEINKLALVQYAYDEGIADHPDNQLEKERIRQKVIINRVIQTNYLDTLSVSEQEVRQLFYDFNTYVRASHLYAPNLDQANELMNRLEAGESFESLAGEIFENPYLAKNAGDLGYFTVDEMDISLEKAAFRAKMGEIVGPIKTAMGYSIVKVTDKNIKPLITEYEFANRKPRFENFALDQKQKLFKLQYVSDFARNLEIDPSYLQDLLDAYANDPLGFQQADEWTLPSIPKNAFKYEGNTLDTELFNQVFELTTMNERNAVQGQESFKEFIQGIAFRVYHIERSSDFNQEDWNYVDASIERTWHARLQNEVKNHLLATLRIPEDSLKNFYQQDPSIFDAPLTLKLKRIRTRNKQDAEQAVSELKQGISFMQVLKTYTAFNQDLISEGQMGWVKITDLGTLASKVKEMEEGDIAGPLEYQSAEWLILVCEARKEPHPQSFDQAKEDVEGTLLALWHQKAIKEVIQKTKNRHEVWRDIDKVSTIKLTHLQ